MHLTATAGSVKMYFVYVRGLLLLLVGHSHMKENQRLKLPENELKKKLLVEDFLLLG
jgi:hypothetical protein